MGLAPANVEPVVLERFRLGLSATVNDELFAREPLVEMLLLNV